MSGMIRPIVSRRAFSGGLAPGERKRGKLAVTHDFGDGCRVGSSGPEPFGADDLRILQGLVAIVGPEGLTLSPEPKTSGGVQLWLRLDPKRDAIDDNAIVVRSSFRKLMREVG